MKTTEEKMIPYTVQMPPSLITKIKAQAEIMGIPPRTYARVLIAEGLKKKK